MAVSKGPLGMNARNFLYINPYNSKGGKRLADDKLETKRLLLSNGISTPNLLASFEDRNSISGVDWKGMPEKGFVVKPARGYGGGGILAIRKVEEGQAITVTGETYDPKTLESHIIDILDGAYSLQYLPDKVFIEERLIPNPLFKKLGALGVPDLRVIVFNHVPVMAMMRFPTEESHGKANIHLGAIGFGIEMRTGITTGAFSKGKCLKYIPGTKTKTAGIKIPKWDEVLLLAAKAQSVSGLGYLGVDIVIDKNEEPMILEVNARPGLEIQNVNGDSLRTRLERVEHISPPAPTRGVELSKALFAKPFAEKVKLKSNVLTVIQSVVIYGSKKNEKIEAKLDTGAFRTSIDIKLAKELELEDAGEKVHVKSASGQKHRKTVHITFQLAGKKITTVASIVDRSRLKYPMIVGIKDLEGFLIKPEHFEDKKVEE
jgi:alpha-L-glutamate ligase-like protein